MAPVMSSTAANKVGSRRRECTNNVCESRLLSSSPSPCQHLPSHPSPPALSCPLQVAVSSGSLSSRTRVGGRPVLQAPVSLGSRTVCMVSRRQDHGRWAGLDSDQSDDQMDIARGRGMVESRFQGFQGTGGTHNAIMVSSDYGSVSAGRCV